MVFVTEPMHSTLLPLHCIIDGMLLVFSGSPHNALHSFSLYRVGECVIYRVGVGVFHNQIRVIHVGSSNFQSSNFCSHFRSMVLGKVLWASLDFHLGLERTGNRLGGYLHQHSLLRN